MKFYIFYFFVVFVVLVLFLIFSEVDQVVELVVKDFFKNYNDIVFKEDYKMFVVLWNYVINLIDYNKVMKMNISLVFFVFYK